MGMMNMRLFIAEKPSVAKAIAAALGVTGRGDGYLECGDSTVTWCFGHMLEQAEPDEYTADDAPTNSSGKKIWRTDDLPIIPEQWIVRPKKEAKKQLTAIGKLIKGATEIVNAGDPDREGNCLVDDVLVHFKYTKAVKRYWASSVDTVSVNRALAALKDNKDYAGWSDAARGRARADWLIGMNLSRAYTLRAARGGSRALLTVGRVQTPTLNLVVQRDKEIEAFKAVPFHTIQAQIQHSNGSYLASWKSKEDQEGLDSEGRLVDTDIANGLIESVKGKSGEIVEYLQEAKKQPQPLAFSLADITVLASSKYGYSAEEVLNTCQALYETHKITSYPRTDCAYLPEIQHADAVATLDAIKHINPELSALVEGADPKIKSRTWNDKKVTAHHGIVPTMQKGDKSRLSASEKNIYDLIVLAYLAQFYPQHEFMHTTVIAEIESEFFHAKGKVITKNGWKDVYQVEEESEGEDEGSQSLPSMGKADNVSCADAKRRDSKTKPPARFTEGTLIRAMENIHRFVTNPAHKKMLREGDGIGTSATRASIIAELKRREFLEVKGKQIVSSTLGRSVIGALPEVVRSPVLTALYERMLKGIESGDVGLDEFIKKQEDFIKDQVNKANDGAVKIKGGKEEAAISKLHKCMDCSAGLVRRAGKKGFWWGCSGYPECKQTYPDIKGKPDYRKKP